MPGYKDKKTIFICQFTDNFLKVIKCRGLAARREFVGLEVSNIIGKQITKEAEIAFSKLGYNNEPVIISFSRILATCRYVKVPSLIPEEIDNMVKLRAAQYLPYPADELITAHQIIQTDKEGYSYINLIIAHKNIVENYLKVLENLKSKDINIILSSYGLCNLYNFLSPAQALPVMIMDVDYEQVELAIVSKGKMTFSRSFKLNNQESWDDLFIKEIKKTNDAYLKEVSSEAPGKILLVGAGSVIARCNEVIRGQFKAGVEILDFRNKVKFENNILNNIFNSDKSFASLIGLGLQDKYDFLNLLPPYIKEGQIRASQRKQNLSLLTLLIGCFLIFGIAININLNNKVRYLEKLKVQLSEVVQQASPLENIENRINLIERQSQQGSFALNILHEIHKIIPANLSLINFTYEENKRVVLRGECPERNSIYSFASNLEKSEIFKDFVIKITFVTQKKTLKSETVTFEIACLKE